MKKLPPLGPMGCPCKCVIQKYSIPSPKRHRNLSRILARRLCYGFLWLNSLGTSNRDQPFITYRA